ncbi:hypothetical protein KAZ82_01125 [Candidatus Babeliales bacterium]|nr:hypothetical protein [Candidatus Babeliales bacterium]
MKRKIFCSLIIFTSAAIFCAPPTTTTTTPRSITSPLLSTEPYYSPRSSTLSNDSSRTNPTNPLLDSSRNTQPNHHIVPIFLTPSAISYLEQQQREQKPNLLECCKRLGYCAVPTMLLGTLVTILIRTGALNFL